MGTTSSSDASMPPNPPSSNEISISVAMLEAINANLTQLGAKVDAFHKDVQQDKVELTERLGDGNMRMALLDNHVKSLLERVTTLETVNRTANPVHVKESVDELSRTIKEANLPAMVQSVATMTTALTQVNLPALAQSVVRLEAGAMESSSNRAAVAVIRADLDSIKNEATNKRQPHWLLVVAASTAVAAVITTMVNAWFIVPSAAPRQQAPAAHSAP